MQPFTGGVPDRSMLDQMVAFIKANLVKTASLGPAGTFPALSETAAARFNDTSWFWTDDNAKAAELLCEPSFYDADPATADAAIDFVLRMSQGAVIQRRCGPAELRILSADPKAFRVETAFFIVEGDLTRGAVRHALRFNDGRTTTAAEHTRNVISFRHAGRAITLGVEDTITAYDVRATEGDRAVVLSHTSLLRRPAAAWRRGGRNGGGSVLGHLTYSYAVSADRPAVTLTVELSPAPGVVLHDVVLSTALDRLEMVVDVSYRTMAIRVGGRNQAVRQVPPKQVDIHRGPAEYWAVCQGGASPGFSYAMHVLLRDGEKLAGISAQAQKLGPIRRVRCRYAMGDVSGGAPAQLQEERMLTGGGYYDALEHYASVLRDGLGGGYADPSMTYDIGAELNAVAVHVLFARTGQYAAPPSPTRLDALQGWYDRHVRRYFDFIRPSAAADDLDRVFTRGLAFVVLSLDCMLRATGDARYRTLLAAGVDLILRTRRRESRGRDAYDATFADTWAGLMPWLDNHAACVLALARAAWHGDPTGALARAVHEGILAIRLYTGTVDLGGGHLEAYDGLMVTSMPDRSVHIDTSFWNFKLGMTLRALHAVLRAAESGIIPMSETERQRIMLRIGVARDRLAQSMRRHGDASGLEVLTSHIAGETNSETQPWVALGLVPVVDERIVRLGQCDGLARGAAA